MSELENILKLISGNGLPLVVCVVLLFIYLPKAVKAFSDQNCNMMDMLKTVTATVERNNVLFEQNTQVIKEYLTIIKDLSGKKEVANDTSNESE